MIYLSGPLFTSGPFQMILHHHHSIEIFTYSKPPSNYIVVPTIISFDQIYTKRIAQVDMPMSRKNLCYCKFHFIFVDKQKSPLDSPLASKNLLAIDPTHKNQMPGNSGVLTPYRLSTLCSCPGVNYNFFFFLNNKFY